MAEPLNQAIEVGAQNFPEWVGSCKTDTPVNIEEESANVAMTGIEFGMAISDNQVLPEYFSWQKLKTRT